ncbi:ref(2)P [Symbiodinium natans]|uniref:Ref(2)P protein n=1 Tax=Symbiodinium natans TaxID=878477 RepID=A0A812RQ04_9DINO|nr:ref(2)P [Symbiodinium natans]
MQGPPPGLEKEDTGDCFGGCTAGPGAWGPGGNGGGPRRLLAALRMLQETGMLTPAMFASLAVQWLPLLTQRVARKVDKINHVARDGLNETWKKLLERIQEQASETPGLEAFASPISEALRSGNGGNGQRRLGEAILELLKALRGLSFEVQTRFCEQVSASLLPFLEDLTRSWTGDECAPSGNLTPWQHHFGIKCEGCGVNPIVGPRFKCLACPNYDLCGNCYPSKIQLHGSCPGCRKDFQCFIFPGKDAKSKNHKGVSEKAEKAAAAADQRAAEFKGWAGKGVAGPLGLMASVAAGLGHGLGAPGSFPFHHFGNFPIPGAEFGQPDDGQQDLPWIDHMPWGKGKGKKGWRRSKGWHPQEEQRNEGLSADEEFEKNLATLRELRLGSDEVLRDLLVACDGDVTRVVRILVHDT